MFRFYMYYVNNFYKFVINVDFYVIYSLFIYRNFCLFRKIFCVVVNFFISVVI